MGDFERRGRTRRQRGDDSRAQFRRKGNRLERLDCDIVAFTARHDTRAHRVDPIERGS